MLRRALEPGAPHRTEAPARRGAETTCAGVVTGSRDVSAPTNCWQSWRVVCAQDFEILMVHSSFDGFLPMYKGSAKDLVSALIDFCGPNRTLVMPSFVMGGRTYDTAAYFRSRPFDVRRTPSDMGLVAEVFRRTPNVLRSLHPTCSVCALGPLGKELTTGHHLSPDGLEPGQSLRSHDAPSHR